MLHFPWSTIVAEAVVEREECSGEDPSTAWVLGELIHYLEHPRSGALLFEITDDAPTTYLPRIDTAPERELNPVADLPAPRGPVRREIRIALREDPEPEPPGEPGWYRDQEQQENADRMRWWDGSTWTEHVYRLPAAPENEKVDN
nr:DUF2510 domain-containing protein [Kineosporia mesophila]